MRSLGDVHSAFFGERPVVHIFYGESPDHPRTDALLRNNGAPCVVDPDLNLEVQRDAAVGFHPILVMAYEQVFDCDVPGAKLSDFLDRLPEPWDFRQQLALAASDEIMELFVRFIEEMNLRNGFAHRDENGNAFFIGSVNAGQRLITVTFGLEPVPGEPLPAA